MLIEAILISSFTLVTAYRPVPEQTKPECMGRRHCETSIGENVSMLGAAVSQDLLASGKVRYRDVLFVPGVGYRIVNDCTHSRLRNTVDIFVYTLEQEKALKPHRSSVWVIKTPFPEIKKGVKNGKLSQEGRYPVANDAKTSAPQGIRNQQEGRKATTQGSSPGQTRSK